MTLWPKGDGAKWNPQDQIVQLSPAELCYFTKLILSYNRWRFWDFNPGFCGISSRDAAKTETSAESERKNLGWNMTSSWSDSAHFTDFPFQHPLCQNPILKWRLTGGGQEARSSLLPAARMEVKGDKLTATGLESRYREPAVKVWWWSTNEWRFKVNNL